MNALIITSQMVQDHEFIYPFYRLKEEGIDVSVYNQSKEIVKGFFGTKIPPQKDDKAIDMVREFNKKDKIIGAICSGTMMLISADIIKGKKISGYYAWKKDIINAGAEFVDSPAVVDGNLVTSPHYKYNGDWMKSVISKFKK